MCLLYSTAKSRTVKVVKVCEEILAACRSNNLSANNAPEGKEASSTSQEDLEQRKKAKKRSRSPMQDDLLKKRSTIVQIFQSMDNTTPGNPDFYQIISSNENSNDSFAPSNEIHHGKSMEEGEEEDSDDHGSSDDDSGDDNESEDDNGDDVDHDEDDEDDEDFLIAYPPIDKRSKSYVSGMIPYKR